MNPFRTRGPSDLRYLYSIGSLLDNLTVLFLVEHPFVHLHSPSSILPQRGVDICCFIGATDTLKYAPDPCDVLNLFPRLNSIALLRQLPHQGDLSATGNLSRPAKSNIGRRINLTTDKASRKHSHDGREAFGPNNRRTGLYWAISGIVHTAEQPRFRGTHRGQGSAPAGLVGSRV